MRKTVSIILLSLFAVLLPQTAHSQIFSKKPSRNALVAEIEKMKRTIDSLKQELEYESIPMIDTLSSNDSINPGRLSFFDSEDFIDPQPSTDSLLSVWYVQRSMMIDENSIINLEDEQLTSDIPDSVYIARLKALNSFIPLPYNNIVKKPYNFLYSANPK